MTQLEPEKPRSSEPFYSQYEAARILRSNGIHCCLWCEDLLWYLNARTVAFDHFFLVSDPERAAQVLENQGFRRLEPNPRYDYLSELIENSLRLADASYEARDENDLVEPPTTVLLPASVWSFPEEQLDRMTDIFPSIDLVASSFIDTWLDAKTMSFRLMLWTYIAAIVKYVQKTQDPRFEGRMQYQYQRKIWRDYKELSLSGSRRPEYLEQRQIEKELK